MSVAPPLLSRLLFLKGPCLWDRKVKLVKGAGSGCCQGRAGRRTMYTITKGPSKFVAQRRTGAQGGRAGGTS